MQNLLEILQGQLSQKEKKTLDKILLLLESATPSISLRQFNEEYLKFAKLRFTSNSIRSIKSSLKILTEHFGETVLLRNLTSRSLEQFLLRRYRTSPSGASLVFRTLKSAFETAKRWNYLQENHLKNIKLPKLPHKNVLMISKDEFRKIVEVEDSSQLKALYKFAYLSGFRLAEVVNCRWSWIDLSERVLTVKIDKNFLTKSKAERVIPISEELYSLLLEIQPKIIKLDGSDFLFTKTKNVQLNASYVSKNFKKCILKANLNPKYHFHHMRSSFASNLLRDGVPIVFVQKMLGHQSVRTTETHYFNIDVHSLKEAMKCQK